MIKLGSLSPRAAYHWSGRHRLTPTFQYPALLGLTKEET